MKRKIQGYLNGAIASISYGTNPLFALPLFSCGIGVNSVLFYRYVFAVLIYGLWLKFFKKTSFKLNFKEFISLFAFLSYSRSCGVFFFIYRANLWRFSWCFRGSYSCFHFSFWGRLQFLSFLCLRFTGNTSMVLRKVYKALP